MINKIIVCENRYLIPKKRSVGVIGETNAEVLHFELPEKINGADIPEGAAWKLLTENTTNGYVEYELNGDFSVPEELTVDSILHVSVGCFVSGAMIWKTYPYDFTFANGLNVNAESIVRNAVIKAEYDKLYDMLTEKEVELPEKAEKPTQADVDELINVASEYITTEDVRAILTDALRAAMVALVSDGYTDVETFENIVGTAEHNYADGRLYQTAGKVTRLDELVNATLHNVPDKIEVVATNLLSELSEFKERLVSLLSNAYEISYIDEYPFIDSGSNNLITLTEGLNSQLEEAIDNGTY